MKSVGGRPTEIPASFIEETERTEAKPAAPAPEAPKPAAPEAPKADAPVNEASNTDAPETPAGFCTNCGAQAPKDSRFCPLCGNKL